MTNYCEKCGVKVDESHHNCPLCGAFIENDEIVVVSRDGGSAVESIDYSFPKVNNENIIRHIMLKIAILLTLTSAAVVLVVDFLSSLQLDWSFHVLVGLAIFWFTLGKALFFKVNMSKHLVWDCMFLILVVIYFQYMFGELNSWWGYKYAFPAIIMAYLLTLCGIMVMKYSKWAEYASSTTLMCILTFFPFVYGFILDGKAHFMSYICAGLGVFVFLFMVIFGKKSYFREMKKRFHI